jgi:predicted nucleic acid-binding protein
MAIEAAYWDTSALVPLCVLQDATPAARREHRRYSAKIVWWGTQVEIRSALARLVRDGEIDRAGRATAVNKWMALSQRTREVPPTKRVLDVASDLPDLAAALVWCKEKPRNRPFVSADNRLAEAAEKAGFDSMFLS